MILGLSVPTFTFIHVILSLFGIGAGIVVFLGMANNDRLEGWTALFLVTTILTSVTGFFFHSKAFGPPHVFGVITLVVLTPAVLGRYAFGLAGWWRLIYIVGAWIALYLNCVVGVIQFFQKFSFLRPFAPTQTEPPFLITQGVLLVFLLTLGVLAGFRFRPTVPRLAAALAA
jgi:hypothetical protein